MIYDNGWIDSRSRRYYPTQPVCLDYSIHNAVDDLNGQLSTIKESLPHELFVNCFITKSAEVYYF